MPATIAFPTSLPCGSIQGYGYQSADALVATDFDAGPRRVRRRYTSVPTRYNVTWTVTQNQLAVFEYWFNNVINYGASYFTIPLTQGAGIQTVDARFVGVPSVTLSEPTEFKISSTLEVLEKPLISGEVYDLIAEYGLDVLLELDDVLNRVMNHDIPEDFS